MAPPNPTDAFVAAQVTDKPRDATYKQVELASIPSSLIALTREG
jgi:hypothetical protein